MHEGSASTGVVIRLGLGSYTEFGSRFYMQTYRVTGSKNVLSSSLIKATTHWKYIKTEK